MVEIGPNLKNMLCDLAGFAMLAFVAYMALREHRR